MHAHRTWSAKNNKQHQETHTNKQSLCKIFHACKCMLTDHSQQKKHKQDQETQRVRKLLCNIFVQTQTTFLNINSLFDKINYEINYFIVNLFTSKAGK